MKFEDIKFKEHPSFANISNSVKEMMGEYADAKQAIVDFENGYTASILFGDVFYSNGIDTYELAIRTVDGLNFTNGITINNQPLGYLTKDELMKNLSLISKLPNYEIKEIV